MTVISLERRLRKVEGRSQANCGPRFFIWVREFKDIDQVLARLPEPRPAPSMTVLVRWTYDEDAAASRWAKDATLSAIEMSSIIEHLAGVPLDPDPPGTPRDPSVAAMSDDQLLAEIIKQGFGR
jgi:hypothetical protein